MSEVVLTVGGRKYTLRCEDGQEDHIRRLAAVVDAKLGDGASQLPAMEAKNLLFAALFLADELEETRKAGAADDRGKIADWLEALAVRLEKTAEALEQAHPNA
ncbi:cell division protein ZapA [Qipengyuania sp. DY56-A-20]|jgi:cell division protein ZapA|uniref:Cell division protein ZapA n=1 Tax=Qipengyuania benthica TaxID=3067651 RepID=A0ABT9H7V2_9SPHN|nr:cell division protein ZapA [Qipengyuania sp. DY56-A-20]MDP4539406.1 cell division protein ZapA [Qipengyuania sp. DY56-A-20]